MSRPSGLLATPFDHSYPRDIETEWIDVMGYAVPLWVSDPESEYRAFREAVGLLEYSMLYRWDIRGPRAAEIANRVHSRNIMAMKPVARLGYSEYTTVENVWKMRRPDDPRFQ